MCLYIPELDDSASANVELTVEPARIAYTRAVSRDASGNGVRAVASITLTRTAPASPRLGRVAVSSSLSADGRVRDNLDPFAWAELGASITGSEL